MREPRRTLIERCGQTLRLPGRRCLPSEIRRRRPGHEAGRLTLRQTSSAVSGKATHFSVEAIDRHVVDTDVYGYKLYNSTTALSQLAIDRQQEREDQSNP